MEINITLDRYCDGCWKYERYTADHDSEYLVSSIYDFKTNDRLFDIEWDDYGLAELVVSEHNWAIFEKRLEGWKLSDPPLELSTIKEHLKFWQDCVKGLLKNE